MDTTKQAEPDQNKEDKKETQELINRVTDKVLAMWRQDLMIERERKRFKRR